MKTAVVFLVTCLLAGSAYAQPKGNFIGKQVHLSHQKMGVVVGRAERGFIVMPAEKVQVFSQRNRQ